MDTVCQYSCAQNFSIQDTIPPNKLFFITEERNVSNIEVNGISFDKQYIFLLDNLSKAKRNSNKFQRPFIYLVNSGQMYRDGFEFFLSDEGWITEIIPARYLVEV